jgi:hypothetical protein
MVLLLNLALAYYSPDVSAEEYSLKPVAFEPIDYMELKNTYKMIRLWDYQGTQWPSQRFDRYYTSKNPREINNNVVIDIMGNISGEPFVGAAPETCLPRNLEKNRNDLLQPPQMVAHIPLNGFIMFDESNLGGPQGSLQEYKSTHLHQGEDFTIGTWVKINDPQNDPSVPDQERTTEPSYVMISKMPIQGENNPSHKPEWEFSTSGNGIDFKVFRYPYRDGKKSNYYMSDLERARYQTDHLITGEINPRQQQAAIPIPFQGKSGKPGVPIQPPPKPIPPPFLPPPFFPPYYEGGIQKHDFLFNLKEFWWAQTLYSTYGVPVLGRERQEYDSEKRQGAYKTIPAWSFIAISFKYSDRINGATAKVMMIQDPSIFGVVAVKESMTGSQQQTQNQYRQLKKSYQWSYKIKEVKIPSDLASMIPINSNSPVRIGASTDRRFSGYMKGTFIARAALTEQQLLNLAFQYRPDQNWSNSQTKCAPKDMAAVCYTNGKYQRCP